MDSDVRNMLICPHRLHILSAVATDNEETPKKVKLSNRRITAKELSAHEHSEIFTVLEGEYDYAFNGAYYHCEPGAVVLINSGVEHESYYEPDTKGLKSIWMMVDDEKIIFSVSECNGREFTPLGKGMLRNETPELKLKKVWDEFDAEPSEFKRNRLKLALSCVFARIIEHGNEKAPDLEEHQERIVGKIKNYISKNLQRGIDISQLEKLSGYSRYHLQRVFKQLSGHTVLGYKNHCRLKRMESMLKEKAPRKNIAKELGFADTHTLYAWHKKILNPKRPTDDDADIYPAAPAGDDPEPQF
jgi:AraC-like DNA-binding protein